MRTSSCRCSQRDRDVKGEQPLAEVVCFTRVATNDLAQRPLQEQQKRDREHQPCTGANDTVEHSVEQSPEVPRIHKRSP